MTGGGVGKDAQCVGVVMAGGIGSRLRRDGVTVDKALVRVAGQPIIQFILDDMRRAGIMEIGVVYRDDQADLRHWLETYAASESVDVVAIKQAMDGTLGAVSAATQWRPDAAIVLSTCDVVAPRGTVANLLSVVAGTADVAAVLATTEFVHDSAPIWVRADDRGHILDLGKDITPTGCCFGHVRVLTPRFAALLQEHTPIGATRDTVVLGRIARAEESALRALYCGDIVDVDERSDLPVAETLASRHDE